MDPTPKESDRGLWAFWIACVLAAVGAVTPFLLSGGSTRVNGALIPFAVGAVAFAVLAMVYHQGRPLATLLYFVASLAVVFGLLSVLALPLRLAVLGTCAGPGPCAIGLEPPITSSETTAMGFAITIGIVSILTGFFGLRTQYHRHRMRQQAAAPASPPARRIPPVGAKPQAQTTPEPSPAPEARPSEVSAAVAESPAEPEPQAELPAHEPDPELPAHIAESKAEVGQAATTTAPQRRRRQRKPKAPPEPPTSTSNTE
jgi:hypothetical protein